MRKYKVCGLLFVLGIALVFAFYTYGAVDNELNISQGYVNQISLTNPSNLMPFAQKVFYEKKSLLKDNRPVLKEPVEVKGIYMSSRIFHFPKYFNKLVELVDDTELNAIVIDMKDDDGFLGTEMDIPLVNDIQVRTHKGSNATENINLLLSKNIYPIARIVVFKDPSLAEKKPELALRRSDGSVWRDRKNLAWVDPHNKEVWEYTVNVAREAAKLGFREIQFDYVRFPTDGNMKDVVYPYANGMKKEDVILEFLKYAYQELQPYNVFIAADVFGLTTLTLDDMGMGQKFEKIITQVDYVCPMVYPSHYGVGNYGFPNPNAYPYEIVKNALSDGLRKAEGASVIIRPWLQDFSLGQPAYGEKEVREQIQATYDVGLREWILWNAGNKYTNNALLTQSGL